MMARASSSRPLRPGSLVVAAAETGQEVRRRQLAGVVGIAAEEDVRGGGIRQILHGHRPRLRAIIGGLRQHCHPAELERARQPQEVLPMAQDEVLLDDAFEPGRQVADPMIEAPHYPG